MTDKPYEILDLGDPRMEEIVRIWGKHDLVEKACEPIDGVVVLLTEGADALKQLAMAIFSDQAVTPDVVKSIERAVTMVQDTLVLGTLSPSVPQPGIVEPYEMEDGTTGYTWNASEA